GHQTYIDGDYSVLKKHKGFNLFKYALELRKGFISTLSKNGLKGDELAIASALVLGFKEYLTEPLKRSYASAGAMHVLAVSGLHVGIIYLLLRSLLFFLKRLRYGKYLQALISLLVLWAYALLTGLSPSVIRAATMFSFFALGDVLNRKSNIYNVLAASAFLILLINPYMIMEVGFQLSYMAVLGIVYVQPRLYSLIKLDHISFTPLQWLLDKIWALTSVSIGAQLGTFPLSLLYFHQFPSYFVFSNLIVIPAAVLILYLGVSALLTGFIPFLSKFLTMLLHHVISLLNWSVAFIDQLPNSIIYGISISILETWLIYGIIISSLFFFHFKRAKQLFAILVFSMCILFIDFHEDHKILHSESVVVYNVKKHSAIEFRSAKNCLIFLDQELLENIDKKTFHLKQNWWNNDIMKPKEYPIGASNKTFNGLFSIAGKSILVISKSNSIDLFKKRPKLAVDYLILSNEASVYLKRLFQFISVKDGVVIDSSFSYKTRKSIKKFLDQLTIPLHDTQTDGAFVLET
ncbi:MAG: ComEC/Rec2 family competence protein, partial [Flavobacteriales bacterium]|nr:ComEC/Rec2 family competence protein [Flavobacteriales bacterium]